MAIRRSKARCWSELTKSVEDDPWGKPYKLVMKKLGGSPPAMYMERDVLTRVSMGLFPSRPFIARDGGLVREVPPLTQEELRVGIERVKTRKKAPGPDGIDTAILVAVYKVCPDWMLDMYNSCLVSGVYTKNWKVARLVLLRKGNKPVNEPSSYRPLCLLNDVGKLFEFLLVRRLEAGFENKGGLSSSQFGFRRSLSTTDAAMVVKNTALDAVNLAVSLDIRNAFNSIGWEHVLSALCRWEVQPYLIRLFSSYFSDRIAEVACSEAAGGSMVVNVTCGVPQGSVVGPLLWNITYDRVLRLQLPREVRLVGFADDTLVVAWGKTSAEVESIANSALDAVATEISALDLALAPRRPKQ